MRLWSLWQPDLPLAEWRIPLVHWLLDDLLHDPQSATPDFFPAMCAAYHVWQTDPTQLDIAAGCADGRQVGAAYRAANAGIRAGEHFPLLQLDSLLPLAVLTDFTGDFRTEVGNGLTPHPATVIALETVVEYAAQRFGDDSISTLLTKAYDHTSWDTLVPVVFGVSAHDFQTGWHAYLAEEYDIQVAPAS